MAGEMDLQKLLGSLSADLIDGVFVFITIPAAEVPQGITPRMMFHEAEGVTLIMLEDDAKAHGLDYEFRSRMITLNVHSSLDAVGFIAHIATLLAHEGMGVNSVAGFYHDHLFVPLGREQDALDVLAKIAVDAV